ncbi:hypothetical protein KAE78_03380 [Microbacterium sp. NIBRBAC000506063]|nr:FGGY family carbohydrate kinase [Microbacterium sp. NIBRBAC000506063]QTV80127.1 hypothetical protein KAE78_03380 [Microbacterium sp. NIBRBAC000506063]
MTEVVIGVDSSTQSCTVEVREISHGRLLSTARAPHPATFPPVSEQHPDTWWEALITAVREATDGLDARVVGLSVGAQCHGLVALDENGRVIRPAKLWNDTTSAGQATEMVERRGEAWWASQIGIVPSAAITISKLAWLRDEDPSPSAASGTSCSPRLADLPPHRPAGHRQVRRLGHRLLLRRHRHLAHRHPRRVRRRTRLGGDATARPRAR